MYILTCIVHVYMYLCVLVYICVRTQIRPLNSHCFSETQGFWSILKVIPSNLTVKTVSLTQNIEPNHPKLG